MTSGERILKRSRDIKRKKKQWSGKTEGKKEICHKKATNARRVSQSLQSPEQKEAGCVANKEQGNDGKSKKKQSVIDSEEKYNHSTQHSNQKQ